MYIHRMKSLPTLLCILLLIELQTCSGWSGVSLPRTSRSEKNPSTAHPLSDCEVLSLETANDRLHALLQHNQTEERISIQGYITAKRAFGSSFAFLDVSQQHLAQPVQAMLKRQDYQGQTHEFDFVLACMVPGVQVQLIGTASPTRNPGQAVLLIHKVPALQQWPRNPQHVRAILLQTIKYPSDITSSILKPLWKKIQMTIDDAIHQHDLEQASMQQQTKTQFLDPWQQVAKKMVTQLPEDTHYPWDVLTGVNQTLPVADADFQTPPAGWKDALEDAVSDTMISPKTVSDTLFSIQQPPHNLTRIQYQVWVQNRRRFRNHITVMDVVEEFMGSNVANDTRQQPRIKSILHPQILAQANLYGSILAPGSQLVLQGQVQSRGFDGSDTNDLSDSFVWVTHVHLLRASWRPATIQLILQNVLNTNLDADEMARALRLSDVEMQDILEDNGRPGVATEIATRLQSAASRSTGTIRQHQWDILDRYEQLAIANYPIENVVAVSTTEPESSLAESASSTVEPASRWQRKKLPQLQWMFQQVKRLCESHPDYPRRPLRILDIGGGRGLLANYLAQSLDVEIHVIDIARRAIANGQMRSLRRELSQAVRYEASDASTVHFSRKEFDLVVALHACGTLTDIALSHAVSNEAAFVICPCCFQSNPQLKIGGTVPVVDWLKVPPEEYATLQQLAEIQGDQKLASRATHAICAVRAESVERHNGGKSRVSIKTFPLSFSTRNFALVGSHYSSSKRID